MGFIDEVERIFENMPDENQVALFSATMPKPIKRIVKRKIPDHVVVQVEESALTTEHIRQRYTVAPYRHRMDALMRILQTELLGTTAYFCQHASRLCGSCRTSCAERLSCPPLHGDMEQPARERVWPDSNRETCNCSSRPTLLPVASMWFTSTTSSIWSCRAKRKVTSTESVEPLAPDGRHRHHARGTQRSAPAALPAKRSWRRVRKNGGPLRPRHRHGPTSSAVGRSGTKNGLARV